MSLDLYQLLPEYMRERDADHGGPLRALLEVIGEQVEILRRDVEGMSDDLFVETCAEWLLPYLGQLVGNQPLHASAERELDTATQRMLAPLALRGPDLLPLRAIPRRADVARTIYYRRRKATPVMLEELARDVTGWPTRVVEFFEGLIWNQHLEHLRPASVATIDLRAVEPLERFGGPFDPFARTIDLRPPGQSEGWHNVPNVGFFLWRLRSERLMDVEARAAESASWRFHLSPLGNPTPLFIAPSERATSRARELDTPGPIRRALFHSDLEAYRRAGPGRGSRTELYGPGRSLILRRNGQVVSPALDEEAPEGAYQPRVVCRRLDPWPASPPHGAVIAVDVTCGRIAVGDGWPDETRTLEATFHYGAPAAMGGGSYERSRWLQREFGFAYRRRVAKDGSGDFTSVVDALADWRANGAPKACITIGDSRTYDVSGTLVMLPVDGSLLLEAENGQRPILRTHAVNGLVVDVEAPAPADRVASLALSGVVVEGFLHVRGDLGHLRLMHTTLVPGRALAEDGAPRTTEASLVVEPHDIYGEEINTQIEVELAFCIAGPLRLPVHGAGLWTLDSIVDGLDASDAVAGTGGPEDPACPVHMERSTCLGSVRVATLDASECIFSVPVLAQREQEGCVRFSFVSRGSRTPKRYRCQPDLEIEARRTAAEAKKGANLDAAESAVLRDQVHASVVPEFSSVRYGRPTYAQLLRSTSVALRTGAEDGSEMGAHSHLRAPQREANLVVRLQEYLPFGLVPSIVYVT
ncbi:MAG: hypothetical protein ABL998_04210 [Planctomycetota bacterium]